MALSQKVCSNPTVEMTSAGGRDDRRDGQCYHTGLDQCKSAVVTLYGREQAGVGTIYTGIRTVTIH